MARGILKSVKFEHNNKVAVKVAQEKQGNSTSNTLTEEDAESTNSLQTTANETVLMLAEAQAQVESMLNQAKLQVSTIQSEAKKKGWEAGYTEAQQVAEQEISGITLNIKQVANSVLEDKKRFLHDSKKEIGELAVAIAEKIIGQQISITPNMVTEIVGQAIKGANITGACRIRVNPSDYELLSPAWNTIPSLQPSDRQWELMPDAHVSQGGCIIEAEGGSLDAQIETQLTQVKDAFEKLKA